jgi:GNAT superfamily N-acetyltransferase
MVKEIAIRPAIADDAEACSVVLCASIRELCKADHGGIEQNIAGWTANKTPGHIVQWLENPRFQLFVAECSDTIAGVSALTETGDILLNYVSPEHRFSGVSRAMLTHMEQTLKALGVATARLESTVTAHDFYQAAGWRDAPAPDTGGHCIMMEKTL